MSATVEELDANASRDLEQPQSVHELPPHDGGWPAWRLLCTAYVFETLLWGFPLSFGVFQEYYSRLPQFQHSPFIGIVGTVATGIAYIAAPIVIPLIERYTRRRSLMIWTGWPLCLLGLVAGSFATSLEALILTQGVMYGVGFIMFYYPILSMLNEFWITKRGMAYGIMCSASGVSGASMPFAVQALLEKYGYQTTLRAIAVGLFVLTGPLIPLLKGRLPESGSIRASRIDWSFVRTSDFWTYNISNFAMGLGYFFPSLYLPSYAVASGLSAFQGALLLAIMSISQVLGQFIFGYFSDRKVPVSVLTLSSSLVAALAIYACWNLARTFAVMTVFAIIYGFFGTGYTATWARIGTLISSEPGAAFAAFGLLNLGKGLGNILTGPIGGALVGSTSTMSGSEQYQKVVLFAGTCMLVSGAIILAHSARHMKLPDMILR